MAVFFSRETTDGAKDVQPTGVHVREMLKESGLRPTRQRVALGNILFGRGHRHVSAESLHEEAVSARVPVSLATVYNTLHQFTEVGLLREIAVDGTKTYFDTNTDDHHHFFDETSGAVTDIPTSSLVLSRVPEAPEGMEVSRVDVVVRIRPKCTSRAES
jgi:Fur family iron response transcriptional regulator